MCEKRDTWSGVTVFNTCPECGKMIYGDPIHTCGILGPKRCAKCGDTVVGDGSSHTCQFWRMKLPKIPIYLTCPICGKYYDSSEGHECSTSSLASSSLGLSSSSTLSDISSTFSSLGFKSGPSSSGRKSKPKPAPCIIKLETKRTEYVIGDEDITIRATIVARVSIDILKLSIDLPKDVKLKKVIPKNHNVSLKAKQKFVITFTLVPKTVGRYLIGPIKSSVETKKPKDTRYVNSSTLNVDVLPKAPHLVIRPQLPEYFPVLEKTDLKLQISNVGRGKAENIIVELQCPRGVSYTEIEKINSLQPNESRTVVTEIHPKTSAREGVNRIKISTQCSYADKRSIEFPEEISINVQTEPPELKPHLTSVNDSEGTAHIRIWADNVGTGLARDVRFKVNIPSDEITIVGGSLSHTEDEIEVNESSTAMDLWLEPVNPQAKTIRVESVWFHYKNAKGHRLPPIELKPRPFKVLYADRRKRGIDIRGVSPQPIGYSPGLLEIKRTEDTNPATKETTVIVRVKNISTRTIISGSIQITKFPDDVLEMKTETVQKFGELAPGKGIRGVRFVFAWKDVWCVEGEVFATITYFDHTQRPYVEQMSPVSFRHICIVLEPSEITQSRFEELIGNLTCQHASTHIRGIAPRILYDRLSKLALLRNFQIITRESKIESDVFEGKIELSAIHRSLGIPVVARLLVRGVPEGTAAVVTMESSPKENALSMFDELVNTLCDRIITRVTPEFKIIRADIMELRQYLESEFSELKTAMEKVGIPDELQLEITNTLHQLKDRTDDLANSFRDAISRFESASDLLEKNFKEQQESFEKLMEAIENLQEVANVPKTGREKVKKLLKDGLKEGFKEALKIALRIILPIPI
ncbi:MAG: hypothetical protein ACFFDD_11695 [Promethearchaeota archaeon]